MTYIIAHCPPGMDRRVPVRGLYSLIRGIVWFIQWNIVGCLKVWKILNDILIGLFQNDAVFNVEINQGNWNHLIGSEQNPFSNNQTRDFSRPWINNNPVKCPDFFTFTRKYFSSFFELHFHFSLLIYQQASLK